MQNRTDYAGLPIRDRLRQTAGQYRRALEMAAAAAGGAVFAGAHILGGIAPFGVALAAAVPEGLFLPALFGALFGYLWFPAPGSAMEYAAAILLLGGVRLVAARVCAAAGRQGPVSPCLWWACLIFLWWL